MNGETEIKRDLFFKYYITCALAAAMHLTFLIAFLYYEITIMVWVNVVSVGLYTVSAFMNLKKDLGRRTLV